MRRHRLSTCHNRRPSCRRAKVPQQQQRRRKRLRGLECAVQRVGSLPLRCQLRAAEGHHVQAQRRGGRSRGGRLSGASRTQQQNRQPHAAARGALAQPAALPHCVGCAVHACTQMRSLGLGRRTARRGCMGAPRMRTRIHSLHIELSKAEARAVLAVTQL